MTDFFHDSRGENKINYIIKGVFSFSEKCLSRMLNFEILLLKHVWYSFSSDLRRNLYLGMSGLNIFLAEDRKKLQRFPLPFFGYEIKFIGIFRL